ncbi:MAG: bifunctional pyr operon transcriptional regulator/uracil phosphoribosyltransferase PyrR [bacterium]
MGKEIIFDNLETNLVLDKFVNNILQSRINFKNTVIIGIKKGGAPLACLIKKAILENFKIDCELGYVDMTFYRDDPFAVKKAADATELPFDINNKEIILVDDVISSGRTVRASIDEIFDFGRPEKIRLAVFIDKGGRELPICPDFTGKKIKAGKKEIIHVDVLSKEKFVEKIIKK